LLSVPYAILPTTMSTDTEVIEAVLAGDVERYAELVDRYQRAAWKLAYSFVGNMDDAKELSQNGFVKAYQHLRQFRKHAKFSTWFYRIIANECKDFFKRKARRPRVVSLDRGTDPDDDASQGFDVADPRSDPVGHVANKELAHAIRDALGYLSENQRAAFVLCYLDDYSLDETAEIMRCRIGTVKSHLFRATERLRKLLRSYESLVISRVGQEITS